MVWSPLTGVLLLAFIIICNQTHRNNLGISIVIQKLLAQMRNERQILDFALPFVWLNEEVTCAYRYTYIREHTDGTKFIDLTLRRNNFALQLNIFLQKYLPRNQRHIREYFGYLNVVSGFTVSEEFEQNISVKLIIALKKAIFVSYQNSLDGLIC